MKLLALDTSSQSASCALCEDGALLGEYFTNVKLTHSQTILPMVEALLRETRTALAEMDYFAVTAGPGSFTGLRIGLSAVKGMAHALQKPCVAVSTLEALACAYAGTDCLIAPVLDARCSQVYAALFEAREDGVRRLWPDRAIPVDTLGEELKNHQKSRVLLVGDGAMLCYNRLRDILPGLRPAPPGLRYTRAFAVAMAAGRSIERGEAMGPGELAPAYLRLPQAERELLAKRREKECG